YSLVRKIIERSKPDMNAPFDGYKTLADVVMAPTHIYVKPVLALMQKITIKGMAHITGGGLLENVPRVLPEGVTAVLQDNAWPRPKLFDWLQAEGQVADNEMHRVFNCGIGMVIIVSAADAEMALAELAAAGEEAYCIGEIQARQNDAPQTIVV
ncbi:MAG: phosphoribosylformylglycinamidine cyclo-ligase, partial [Proteobacteria bacterium]|nr:phosphoribosylformylglycinamidine cyclo-ligase [Pseudomonadota bacterium]